MFRYEQSALWHEMSEEVIRNVTNDGGTRRDRAD